MTRQLIFWSVEPETVAVNWRVPPVVTVAVPGETVTFGVGGGGLLLLPEELQAEDRMAIKARAERRQVVLFKSPSIRISMIRPRPSEPKSHRPGSPSAMSIGLKTACQVKPGSTASVER